MAAWGGIPVKAVTPSGEWWGTAGGQGTLSLRLEAGESENWGLEAFPLFDPDRDEQPTKCLV